MNINLKHLYYFWKVASLGGVQAASRVIHITPQTLSGQINLLEERLGVLLFTQSGRKLALTRAGEIALDYAQELFTLSAELDQVLRFYPKGRAGFLRIGISNTIPKALVYQFLRPVRQVDEGTDTESKIQESSNSGDLRLICREWDDEKLLAYLALHRLDLVLTDHPSTADIKAYHHKLGDSPLVWLSTKPKTAIKKTTAFPALLHNQSVLMPSESSFMRRLIDAWLDQHKVQIRIAGEFDDFALMSAFGREGAGAFVAPKALVPELTADKRLRVLGAMEGVQMSYYAITVHRKINHPSVQKIVESAAQML